MADAFAVNRLNPGVLRAINYTPEVERFRRARLPTRRLGSLLSEMGRAYGSVFTRRDCEPQHGIELVSQGDMFATEPHGRVIRRDSMAKPERHEVKKWQVLIAGAGTLGETELFGRAIIADDRLAGKYVGPHAMVLTFSDPASEEALFAYAFLCTRTGIRAARSTSFGTKILGLRKDLLADLPIPVPQEPSTTLRVAAHVRSAVENRERAAAALALAKGVLSRHPDVLEAAAMLRDRRSVSWGGPLPTLCAWNFASAGSALAYLKRQWNTRVADLVVKDGIFNGPRFARIPCTAPHGVDFLSQRDIFLIRPVPRRIVHPGFADKMLFVDSDCLLLGSHGQLSEGSIFGRVELAACGASACAITQDILRVRPRDGARDLLYGFLATDLGHALLKSTAIGTSIPSVRVDLALDLPAPELDARQLRDVRAAVTTLVEARRAADVAESEAVRIVEREVLPRWLA